MLTHGILPFSKSYREIESTWPIAKCREIKSFDKWYYIVICERLCVSFSSEMKAINVFPKHILKLKAHDKSIQARKKLFCQAIVKNFVKVSDQNWKQVEARNQITQRIGTPANFMLPWYFFTDWLFCRYIYAEPAE